MPSARLAVNAIGRASVHLPVFREYSPNYTGVRVYLNNIIPRLTMKPGTRGRRFEHPDEPDLVMRWTRGDCDNG